jgi:hypothetical protein
LVRLTRIIYGLNLAKKEVAVMKSELAFMRGKVDTDRTSENRTSENRTSENRTSETEKSELSAEYITFEIDPVSHLTRYVKYSDNKSFFYYIW